MLVLSHNEAHDAYHLGICGKHRRCLGCIPRRQTPCGQVVGKWPGSERQEESRSGGRWAGLDRTAAMLSVKLKLEWPIEPRSWEVLLQGRNKFRRASPLHVKAVLGELRRQHSQSSRDLGTQDNIHARADTCPWWRNFRQDGSNCQKVKWVLTCGTRGPYLTHTHSIFFHCNLQKAILDNKSDGVRNATFCSEIQKPYFS